SPFVTLNGFAKAPALLISSLISMGQRLTRIRSSSGQGGRHRRSPRRRFKVFEDSGAGGPVHTRGRGAPVDPCCRGVSVQHAAWGRQGPRFGLCLGGLLGEPPRERTLQPLHQGRRPRHIPRDVSERMASVRGAYGVVVNDGVAEAAERQGAVLALAAGQV